MSLEEARSAGGLHCLPRGGGRTPIQSDPALQTELPEGTGWWVNASPQLLSLLQEGMAGALGQAITDGPAPPIV